jgi:type IV pilus assembly protein PilC
MPKFKYTALAANGATVTGTTQAASATLVTIALADRDLRPVKVLEKKSIWQFEITRKKVPARDLMHFSRQLAVFTKAAVPIIEGLQTITEETTNKLFKKGLLDIIEALEGGSTFTEAAARHPEIFPDVYLGMLQSAEMTGRLDTVLDQLAVYLERDLEARRMVTSALVYPSLVMLMAFVTVGVLAIYVMPKFRTFFKTLNAKLPLATRMLLDFTSWLGAAWPFILLAIVIIAAGVILVDRTEWGRARRDNLLVVGPVVGDLARHAIIERFCRVLSAMVHAGVPLPDALAVTAQAANNVPYRNGILAAREEMLRGAGFSEPLAKTRLFPSAITQMFRVGEDTGSLDEQMDTAATYYARELDYRIKRFTSLFEPAVIVFVGLIVGFVAIALVSAMYGIFRQVHP